jgi:NAD(P)-dependent dehydrogenase (short-subunit alcohol dehydrogenase family)
VAASYIITQRTPIICRCDATGIGKDTVELFVAEGARVVFCGRGVEAGQAIAARCGGDARCVFVAADVRNEADVKQVIETAVERFGKLDCLFNNAGGGTGMPSVTALSDGYIRYGFGLNFDSVVSILACFIRKHETELHAVQ